MQWLYTGSISSYTEDTKGMDDTGRCTTLACYYMLEESLGDQGFLEDLRSEIVADGRVFSAMIEQEFVRFLYQHSGCGVMLRKFLVDISITQANPQALDSQLPPQFILDLAQAFFLKHYEKHTTRQPAERHWQNSFQKGRLRTPRASWGKADLGHSGKQLRGGKTDRRALKRREKEVCS